MHTRHTNLTMNSDKQTANSFGPKDGSELKQHLILVVEDDKAVRELIKRTLIDSSYRVETVTSGEDVLPVVQELEPGLILLDLGLPDVDGLEILTILREKSQTPVICVTARAGETDRVVGLEMGADDYIVKPFSPRELVARVRTVLRRSELKELDQPKLEFGELAIDTETREVLIKDKCVHLTTREFDLLVFLASSPRRVYSRNQLLENVWGSSSDWQDPSTVTEIVRRLRQKIEVESDSLPKIETVRGVGYRFEP